jgi:hypothetical protein
VLAAGLVVVRDDDDARAAEALGVGVVPLARSGGHGRRALSGGDDRLRVLLALDDEDPAVGVDRGADLGEPVEDAARFAEPPAPLSVLPSLLPEGLRLHPDDAEEVLPLLVPVDVPGDLLRGLGGDDAALLLGGESVLELQPESAEDLLRRAVGEALQEDLPLGPLGYVEARPPVVVRRALGHEVVALVLAVRDVPAAGFERLPDRLDRGHETYGAVSLLESTSYLPRGKRTARV